MAAVLALVFFVERHSRAAIGPGDIGLRGPAAALEGNAGDAVVDRVVDQHCRPGVPHRDALVAAVGRHVALQCVPDQWFGSTQS